MSPTSLPDPLGLLGGEEGDMDAELPPVSGATLFRLEMARRRDVRDKGVVATGCGEIDDGVLMGGFERGVVVGVSALRGEFGVSLGLQTVARALVCGESGDGLDGAKKPKVAIVTILPTLAISLRLRDAIRSQLQAKFGPRHEGVNDEVRRCLEAVDVSQVFDVDGLGLVLQDMEVSMLDRNQAADPGGEEEERGEADEQADAEAEDVQGQREDSMPSPALDMSLDESHDRVTELPPLRIQSDAPPPRIQKTVIEDSEDEEPFSSSPLSSLESDDPRMDGSQLISAVIQDDEHQEHPADPDPDTNSQSSISAATVQEPSHSSGQPSTKPHTTPQLHNTGEQSSQIPEIILITHFSTLLTTLFTNTNHDRTRAHTSLQRLSSHLRYLARSSGSLIMLLNTTTSHTSTTQNQDQNPNQPPNPVPYPHDPNPNSRKDHKPLDPSLRSIFSPSGGGVAGGGGGIYGGINKPNFGQTFTQFLDLHLLCTKIPRSRDDAEAYIALGSSEEGIHMVWVVECLMDELGFWDWGRLGREIGREDRGGGKGKGKGKRTEEDERLPVRVSREQRWGAVVMRDGVVVNAFRKEGLVDRGAVRVVAGFGGPRV
ncbi:hypothetical protein GGR57DRAFT_518093 [Xylariaceae sp. FL1272]|nr:hypothetical protein GGR57DRAFT_518093 [Xylariaceae sp. FL1272]